MTSVLGSGRASGGPSGQLRCKSKRRRRRRSKRKGKRDVIFLLFYFPTLSACHLHSIGCSQLYCQCPALAGSSPALPRRPGRGGRCLPRGQPGTRAAVAVPAAGHSSLPSPPCAGPRLNPRVRRGGGARQAPSGSAVQRGCPGAPAAPARPARPPCPPPAPRPGARPCPRAGGAAARAERGAEPPGAVAPSKLPLLSSSRQGPPSFSVLVLFPVPKRTLVRKALIAVSRKSEATGCHCEQGICPR